MTESEGERKSKCRRLYVAAIDFGTTYSGYAFSSKDNWTKVITNHTNLSGGRQVSQKAPTALLLYPDKSFKAFGYEAEQLYANLASEEDSNCKSYYFFQKFKLILKTDFEQRVHRKTPCLDMHGKSLDAITVFTYCIEYLKKQLLKALSDSVAFTPKLTDIDFVLTVPAIWDDTAKMFMREAAIKAGIPDDQLLIALEPEAASMYCQLMYLEPQNDSSFRLMETNTKAKYMVVDLGGGTADITVHQLKENGTIAELAPASGGLWGGLCIDQAFKDLLEDVFGEETMKQFYSDEEYVEDVFDFWQRFEIKKRALNFDNGTDYIHLGIPMGFTDVAKKVHKKNNHKDIIAIIENSKLKGRNIKFENGKLHIPTVIIEKMFRKVSEKIVNHIKNLLEEVGENLKVILMVGGFSDCSLIQKHFCQTFDINGKTRVVIPNQCELAVLKGAVYFGHNPDMITERVSRYTYGIQIWPKFDRSQHKTEKLVSINSEKRCKDVFFKFVTKGERVPVGLKKSYALRALDCPEGILECGIFISSNKNPQYIDDDDCEMLGVLKVNGVEDGTEIEESLIFGKTEIQAMVWHCTSKKQYSVVIDLLSEETKYPRKN